MNLSDLDASWKNGILTIDCPCGKHAGKICIRTQRADGPKQSGDEHVWQVSGEYPNLTLHPSVNAGCWHGWIKNGEVT